MRIAYLSAGISVHDRRYLQKMVERGHQPFLISFWNDKVDFHMEGVEFFHCRPKYFSKIKKIIYLRKLLRKIRPDVLHTGFLQTHGFIGSFMKEYPILSMPWGSDVLILPEKSLFHKLVAKHVLRRADMITCDCELVKRRIVELVKYDPAKIVVIPCGVDLKIYYPQESSIREKLGWQDNRILIMNRSFKPVYGIEYFIEALPEVIIRYPETRVVLAGDGPLGTEIRRRVSELGLKDYVHFAGFIDNDKVMADHLNSADIYISTSLSDGTSVSLLEAMACRLPVVVTDLPANREWIEDGINGYVIPAQDSKILAQKILNLAKDDNLRKRMAELNFQKAREKADWDKNFIKLEEMYKTICQEYSQ